jgi:hypothetical protein
MSDWTTTERPVVLVVWACLALGRFADDPGLLSGGVDCRKDFARNHGHRDCGWRILSQADSDAS